MKRDLCKTGVAAFGRKLANEFSNDVTRLALSLGEGVRGRAGVHLTFQNGNRESYNRPHPGLTAKLVLTTVLTPALSSEEREKRSPRFWQIQAADFTTRHPHDGRRHLVKSSPGGEDLGEGGQWHNYFMVV